MPRPLRVVFLGVVYHVTAGGNAPLDAVSDDCDRLRVLAQLERTATVQEVKVVERQIAGRSWIHEPVREIESDLKIESEERASARNSSEKAT